MKKNKDKCHNCRFKGHSFKIGKVTHLHCQNRELYPEDGFTSGKISAWDTLRIFGDTCDKHEFKEGTK